MDDLSISELVEREAADYKKILERFIPNPKQDCRVLNLFCGAVVEEPALFDHFGSESDIQSFDKSEEMGIKARELHRTTFRGCDIHQIEWSIYGQFDYILMRNPPIVNDDSRYEFRKPYALLRMLTRHTRTDSELLITLLNCHEVRILPQSVIAAGYRIQQHQYTEGVRSANIGWSASNKDYYAIHAKAPNWLSKITSLGMKPGGYEGDVW